MTGATSFVILATTFMTGSRAGSVLSLLAIAGAFGTAYRRELRERGLLLVFPLAAALAIVVALATFAPPK